MTISKLDLQREAMLLKISFHNLFVQWGKTSPTRTGLHASAVLVEDEEWCVRRHTLAALYPEAVEPPFLQLWHWHEQAVFLNGWRLHEKWQALFKDHMQVLEIEITHFDETRNLYFTPDALISFGGVPYIVEIKGYKSEHFAKLDENGDPPEYAWKQCNLYLHLLQLQRGIILVENKDTQDIKLWIVEYDHEMVQPLVQRIYAVKRAVVLSKRDLEKLPARICQSRDDARARRCPMRDTCFLKLKPLVEIEEKL